MDRYATFYDIWSIIDRVKEEAEDTDQMAEILKWETHAYLNLLEHKKPCYVEMYNTTVLFNNWDKAVIGKVWMTKEDYESDNYGYIVPISTIKDGHYDVQYTIVWKSEI